MGKEEGEGGKGKTKAERKRRGGGSTTHFENWRGGGGGGSLRCFLVGGGRLETRLFRVYFIMPRRLGPSFRNLILQRLITV